MKIPDMAESDSPRDACRESGPEPLAPVPRRRLLDQTTEPLPTGPEVSLKALIHARFRAVALRDSQ